MPETKISTDPFHLDRFVRAQADHYDTALAELRAPIYEEKVVDLIVGVADVTDKPITKEELLKEDELVVAQGKLQPDRCSGGLRLNANSLLDLPGARAPKSPKGARLYPRRKSVFHHCKYRCPMTFQHAPTQPLLYTV